MSTDRAVFDRATGILRRLMLGDESAFDELVELTQHPEVSPPVADFIETIGQMFVALEAREFRLELMVAELIELQKSLQAAKQCPVTGLANRKAFHEYLAATIDIAQRTTQPFVLLFIDLDKFKHVNDTKGHDAGDELLQQVAARLSALVREGDLVARLGGDEFAIVVAPPAFIAHAEPIAARIVTELCRPFDLVAGTVQIGGSVGVAQFPTHGTSEVRLLKSADVAMYEAKTGGRNRYVIAGRG